MAPAQLEEIDVTAEALELAVNHAYAVFQEFIDAAQAVKQEANRLIAVAKGRKTE